MSLRLCATTAMCCLQLVALAAYELGRSKSLSTLPCGSRSFASSNLAMLCPNARLELTSLLPLSQNGRQFQLNSLLAPLFTVSTMPDLGSSVAAAPQPSVRQTCFSGALVDASVSYQMSVRGDCLCTKHPTKGHQGQHLDTHCLPAFSPPCGRLASLMLWCGYL